jgi:uncharacterized protein (DUF1501 family)
MNRREFLSHLGMGAVAVGATRVWAAPSAGNTKLLVVMLRGAYDGMSLFVPHSSTFYYESRPTIAVPRPGGDPSAALALTADWSLNPVAREGLGKLWSARQLAFVPFSGSQDRSRSHFQAQDAMELGQGDAPKLDYGSGFLNRLVAELGGAGGVAFTQNTTPVFKGAVLVPNVSLGRGIAAKAPPMPGRQSAALSAMYEGTKLGQMAQEGMETRREVTQTLSGLDMEMEQASRGAGGANAFDRTVRAIGTLMRTKPEYAVGFVDVGGWDTHVNQGPVQGQLANNLQGLSSGLATFADTMGAAWADTVVVVMSEFGRTFRENGNRGTDHGHGNVMLVAGGRVRGGIAGRQTTLSAGTLFENRDLPVLNDYRAVLASVFARLYGVSDGSLQRVFPGLKVERFDLV